MAASSFPHPYEAEIRGITYSPALFSRVREQLFRPLAQTPVTWVETVEQLRTLAALLDASTEFAVDLEHHDYRSFQGF